MTAKERLHQLVEELPEGAATSAAERILAHLTRFGDDPVLRALMQAPADDEPETDDERAAAAEGGRRRGAATPSPMRNSGASGDSTREVSRTRPGLRPTGGSKSRDPAGASA